MDLWAAEPTHREPCQGTSHHASFPNNFVINKKEKNVMHAKIRLIYFDDPFTCDLITFFTILASSTKNARRILTTKDKASNKLIAKKKFVP